MAQTSAVEARIREFVLKNFPLIRKRGIKDNEKWLENGLLDSFGILEVVRFLEEQFAIHVSDEELLPENFQSLDALAAFVHLKLSAGRRGNGDCG